MARTLNLPTKRFALAELGPDWQDAYIDYVPLTARDILVIQKLDPEAMSSSSVEYALQSIDANFRGGKISVLTDNGVELVDATVEDVGTLPLDTLMRLFTTMGGGAGDPKDAEPTATQSSTASQKPLSPTSQN